MVGGKVVYRSRMLGSRKNADWVIQEGAA
jgi:hypothetical protein